MAPSRQFGQVELELDELGSVPPPAEAESGVSAREDRDDRVAAMRNLYARGETEAALALGASLACLFDDGEPEPLWDADDDDDDDDAPTSVFTRST